MKNNNQIILGVILIVVGIIIGLNSLNITNIDIFFKGWWTLFIIVPSFIGIINEEDKTGNLIGLIIGLFLLLGIRDIINIQIIGKLIFPTILVILGLSLLFKEFKSKSIVKKINNVDKNNLEYITATFKEQKVVVDKEKFTGANLDAIFGSVKLDLTNGVLEKETIIKATAIFGEIDITVPKECTVKIKATPIFGSIKNKTDKKDKIDKIIYIEAITLFGGIDLI